MISSKSEQTWQLKLLSFTSGNQGVTFTLLQKELYICITNQQEKPRCEFNFSHPRFVMKTQSRGCPPHLPPGNLYCSKSTHLISVYLPRTCSSLDGTLRQQRGLGTGSLSANVKHRPSPGENPETCLVPLPFLALHSVTAAWSRRELVQNPLTKIILVCLLGRRPHHQVSFRLGLL